MAKEAALDDRAVRRVGLGGGLDAEVLGPHEEKSRTVVGLRVEAAKRALDAARGDLARYQRALAHKARDLGARRVVVYRLGGAGLEDPAVDHHRHSIGHRQRLLLIVGDEQRRDPGRSEDPPHLLPQPFAERRVEAGEWLVEKHQPRLRRQRASQRHPLLLAAGELVRIAVGQSPHADQRQHLADPAPARRAVARPVQAVGDVAVDREVGEERALLKTIPICRRSGATQASGPVKVSPPRTTVPVSGLSKPAIARRSVVLPQPLGPTRVVRRWRGSSSSAPSTARTAP